MMIMMNSFCGIVDQRKTFSLISSLGHCQRFSTSQISDMPQTRFELAQNLSSVFSIWCCAVVITTKLPLFVIACCSRIIVSIQSVYWFSVITYLVRPVFGINHPRHFGKFQNCSRGNFKMFKNALAQKFQIVLPSMWLLVLIKCLRRQFGIICLSASLKILKCPKWNKGKFKIFKNHEGSLCQKLSKPNIWSLVNHTKPTITG